MTARVLVATDLSPISDEALTQGEAFARLSGARLGVVHVIPNIQPVNTFFPQLNVGDHESHRDGCNRRPEPHLNRA